MNSKILVTGGSGFVGGGVLRRLRHESGWEIVAAVRSSASRVPGGVVPMLVGELGPDTDWSLPLDGVDAVVHCAARVHVMKDVSTDLLSVYRQVNVEGTLALARQAAVAGVRRFIFVSSVKVNGESTSDRQAYREVDPPAPEDAYGMSKREAEDALMDFARKSGLEVVVIRPPLVYGPGVKGNFSSMMHWVANGLPLPLGAVRNNRRSLVSLDNLVDLIVTCIDHPAAANQVFLAGDGVDLSTAAMLEAIGSAMNRSVLLVPVPVWLLEHVAAMFGKRDVARRLCGSLQVDISKARDVLGWTPPISLEEGMRRAVCTQGGGCGSDI